MMLGLLDPMAGQVVIVDWVLLLVVVNVIGDSAMHCTFVMGFEFSFTY